MTASPHDSNSDSPGFFVLGISLADKLKFGGSLKEATYPRPISLYTNCPPIKLKSTRESPRKTQVNLNSVSFHYRLESSNMISTEFKTRLPSLGLKDKSQVRNLARIRLRARQLSIERPQLYSDRRANKSLNHTTQAPQLSQTTRQVLDTSVLLPRTSQAQDKASPLPKISVGIGESLAQLTRM